MPDSDAQRLLALEQALSHLSTPDTTAAHRSVQRMKERLNRGQAISRDLERTERLLGKSERHVEQRTRLVPTTTYPEELPVSQRRTDILDALRENQVVIVCGDTGSGKTTQLPKLLLDLGLGRHGTIGCTQPRRLAAVSVAQRVAEELNVRIGDQVGYQVRFDDRTSAETLIKFMTDGILLAETQGDRQLKKYEALIIDEAHERSLNIDFLLGYLHQLLPRRPDLKIIISSATLDASAFSDFFGKAPVIDVAGRTFPIEDIYLPARNEDEPLGRHVVRAVEAIQEIDPTGDILVFLPGEREIRDAADKLNGRRLNNTEVLPLFARLELRDQQRVFQVGGRRRIVLATNVAETSLTIPGIKFVIDSGLARITGFNTRTQVQSLQVRPISQASARQRRGRCGRICAGVCVRLYDEDDHEQREAFTPPEIRRSSLAGVILQMKYLGLPDIRDFPFVDPPQKSLITDGLRTLKELGALNEDDDLTELGRELARFPVDPRIARMIAAANEYNSLREVLIISAGLSVQDVRDRPQERQQEADEAHAEWSDPKSDFLSLLRVWDSVQAIASKSALRRFCRVRFLSYRRVLEWQNILRELAELIKDLKWTLPAPSETHYDSVHKALLAGLPSQVGWRKEHGQYQGSWNRTFSLFPGSGLFDKAPEWVVAFALVETTKLYARQAAKIEPHWLEEVAPHLCKPSWTEPAWSETEGFVYAKEAMSCCGLRILHDRRIHYGRVQPLEARDIFIRHGLTPGKLRSTGAWLQHHRKLLRDIDEAEQKLRRPHGLLDEESIVQAFEAQLPGDIHNTAAFDKWRVSAEARAPRCLFLRFEDVTYDIADDFDPDHLPDEINGHQLRYQCCPGERADGITFNCKIEELDQLPDWTGDWLVAGWLPEKVTHLLRSLPKQIRANIQPMAVLVGQFVSETDAKGPLIPAICQFLRQKKGMHIEPSDFDPSRVPEHLQMYFCIRDETGTPVFAGRELSILRSAAGRKVVERFQDLTPSEWEKTGATTWTFGTIPNEVAIGDGQLTGYPALVEEPTSVGLTVFQEAHTARAHHRLGLVQLIRLAHPGPCKYADNNLPLDNSTKLLLLVLGAEPKTNPRDLVNRAIIDLLGEVRDRKSFEQGSERLRGELYEAVNKLARQFEKIASAYETASASLEALRASERSPVTVLDVDKQIHSMFTPRFLFESDDLPQLPRYLEAIGLRLQRADVNPEKDQEKHQRIAPFQAQLNSDSPVPFRRMLQEFRIAVFAPEIGTKQKVSEKRLQAALNPPSNEPDATTEEAAPPVIDTSSLANDLAKAWGN